MAQTRLIPSTLALCALAAVATAQTPPAFSDQGASTGLQFTHDIPGNAGVGSPYSHANYVGGGSAGDFDNDGWMDVFAISGGGSSPDFVFINDGDGTFTNQAASWGITVAHLGKGSSAADFNNDGFLDVYETSAGPIGPPVAGAHKLYKNDGSSFTDVAVAAGVNFTTASVAGATGDGFGSSWGDHDLDGDLDLFVAGFRQSNLGSRLFESQISDGGGETFVDVTAAIGFWDGVSYAAAFAPHFSDMDGDQYPDMLISADFGTMKYFANDGDGTYTEMTNQTGTFDAENGMGGTVRDFDGDGDRDWYVTSIYQPGIGWTGNKLHLYTGTGPGDHSFVEMAGPKGVQDGGYGWGTVGADFNHDGLMDIAETNGDDSGAGSFANERSYLWMQMANGTFSELSAFAGFNDIGKGRGMINFDADNDGDQDMVVFRQEEPVTFWRNDLMENAGADGGSQVNWLRIFLDTTRTDDLAAGGIGAEVVVSIGEDEQMRNMDPGDNFLSSSEPSAHFGLGTATLVDRVSVYWNDDTVTRIGNVAANQTFTLTPTFRDLESGKPGTGGVEPFLYGEGELEVGESGFFHLIDAAPSTTTNLFIGLGLLNASFKGGTLVPTPDLLISGLPVSASGDLSLPYNWPSGIPAGTDLYFQHWVNDSGATKNLAASNGLRGTAN